MGDEPNSPFYTLRVNLNLKCICSLMKSRVHIEYVINPVCDFSFIKEQINFKFELTHRP